MNATKIVTTSALIVALVIARSHPAYADCPSLGARLDAVGFALDHFVEAMDYGNAPVNAKANAAWESARQNMGKASGLQASCAGGSYESDYGYYAIEARYAHEGYIYDRLSDRVAYEMFVRDLQHLKGFDRNDAEIDLAHIKQGHPSW
ncbi:MAG TPA: hypothetical protein VN934_03610 [Candidatus Tumulicola sp.]|nr:hypothetical protein [Candidatus Tumulicola sp.]